MQFEKNIYQDGWLLFWRMKWLYLIIAIGIFVFLAACALLVSLLSGLLSAVIIFVSSLAIYFALVYLSYVQLCGVLTMDPLKVSLDGTFWRFLAFSIVLGVIIALAAFALFGVGYGIGVDFFAGLSKFTNSPQWLTNFVFTLALAPVFIIVSTILPAYLVDVNSDYASAFGRIKGQYFYVLSRHFLLVIFTMLVTLGVPFVMVYVLAIASIEPNSLLGIALFLPTQILMLVLIVSLGSAQWVLLCRVYVRADFDMGEGDDVPLVMPYLANPRFASFFENKPSTT